LTRDLGTPSNKTTSWKLSGLVKYEGNAANDNNDGQFLDILDDSPTPRIIARLYPRIIAYPGDERFFANTAVLLQTDAANLRSIMTGWLPLQVSTANGQVTFQYGIYGPVTTGIFDAQAAWWRPKSLRSTFTTPNGQLLPRSIYFEDLSYAADTAYEGLVLWLRADDLTGSNGMAVSVWPDASGRGNDVKQSTSSLQPILHTGANGMNSLNVVTFDGVDDYLKTAFDVGNSGLTVFYIARTGASVPYIQNVLSSGGPSDTSGVSWGWGLGSHTIYGAGYAGGGGTVAFGAVPGIAPNKGYYARYRTDKTAWSIDGVNTNAPADTSFPKGLFNAFVGPFQGDIAEIRVYDRVLSDTECASVTSAMKTKWGLP